MGLVNDEVSNGELCQSIQHGLLREHLRVGEEELETAAVNGFPQRAPLILRLTASQDCGRESGCFGATNLVGALLGIWLGTALGATLA